MKKAYLYYRQSTVKQQQSGLGIAAQKTMCEAFCELNNYQVLGEYTETASGASDDRKVLKEAMAQAKRENAYIIVAKLDRISRRVTFIANLMEQNVKFITAELGEGVNPFMLHVYASFAELERKKISERVTEALKEAKKRGIVLGNPRWDESIGKARDEKTRKANKFNKHIKIILTGMLNSGIKGYAGLANELNSLGYKTRRGCEFKPTTVFRIMNAT